MIDKNKFTQNNNQENKSKTNEDLLWEQAKEILRLGKLYGFLDKEISVPVMEMTVKSEPVPA